MNKLLDFSLTKYSDPLDGTFSHFEIVKEIHELGEVKGFGSDADDGTALKKAVSEFYERYVFKSRSRGHVSQTSNGYACHSTYSEAATKAVTEIIERDSVMYGWLTYQAPYWLSTDEMAGFKDLVINNQIDLLNAFGFKICIGINSITNNIYTIVSILLSKSSDTGFVFCSSASSNLVEAVKSNIFDQRRAAALILSRRTRDKSIFTKLTADEILTPAQHMEFYLNPENAHLIEWYLRGSETINEFSNIPISVEEIKIDIDTPWELHVAKASSELLQDYFVGLSKPNILNKKRFEKAHHVNLTLHPLA